MGLIHKRGRGGLFNRGTNKSYNVISYWASLLATIGYSHPMLPGLTIDKLGGVFVITSHTIDSFRASYPTPVIKYVNWSAGADTNDGNSAGAAYKTVSKLMSVAFDRAYFVSGNYANTAATNIFSASGEIFCSSGRASFMRGATGENLSWTNDGGGMYHASTTLAPQIVCDTANLDLDGDPNKLTAVANSTLVGSTANSYYKDAGGGVIYVHLADGSAPGNNLCIVTAAVAVGAGVTVYGEGLRFFGMSATNTGATKTTIAVKNVIFGPAPGIGMSTTGNIETWAEDCYCVKSANDGYYYSDAGVYSSVGVEVNCIARDNGTTTSTGTSNCTTTHVSCKVLRLRGRYTKAEGPCVADSGSAETLNISVVAGNSVSLGAAATKSAFTSSVGSPQSTKMWLFDCSNLNDGGGTYGAVIIDTTNAKIYSRKSTITNIEQSTVLTAY